jgi:hypothetical protein
VTGTWAAQAPDVLRDKAHRLDNLLDGCGSVLVAFSGGVDSALVAVAAARRLPRRHAPVDAIDRILRSRPQACVLRVGQARSHAECRLGRRARGHGRADRIAGRSLVQGRRALELPDQDGLRHPAPQLWCASRDVGGATKAPDPFLPQCKRLTKRVGIDDA